MLGGANVHRARLLGRSELPSGHRLLAASAAIATAAKVATAAIAAARTPAALSAAAAIATAATSAATALAADSTDAAAEEPVAVDWWVLALIGSGVTIIVAIFGCVALRVLKRGKLG